MHGSHDQTRGADSGLPPARRCDEIAPLLDAFHDGMLPAASARAVAEHLMSCAACRAALDELAEVYRLIQEAPAPVTPPTLRRRLYARIAAAGEQHSTPSGGAPLRFSEDVMYDTGPHPTYAPAPAYAPRKLNVWLSSLAAVAVVALIAGVFFALPHSGKQSHLGAGGSTATTGATNTGSACAPGATKASLPSHAYLTDLAMVSPTDGWAVGAVGDGNGGWACSLIMHFANGRWIVAPFTIQQGWLGSISMDSTIDGWAVGTNNASGQQLVVHYSSGAWHQVTLPSQMQSIPSLTEVRMYSANEGWVVGSGQKDAHGLLPAASLLHYANGTWTQVTAPFGMIDDVAPVGPDDAWITGTVSDADKTGMLAHYHDGQWTRAQAPSGIEFTSLRVVSPSDVWASGETHPGGNYREGNAYPVVAHFDGTSWKLSSAASGPAGTTTASRFVASEGDGEGWAYDLTKQPIVYAPSNLGISRIWRENGGQWHTVPWTYTNLDAIIAWTHVSNDEYWAIGVGMDYHPNPHDTSGNSVEGIGYTVLLHYAGGTWTQYGR